MSPADRKTYWQLARTFWLAAQADYRHAKEADQAGDIRFAAAWREQGQSHIRDAKRWDALAKLGAA